MISKEQVMGYIRKKLVIQVRAADKPERFYVILVKCDDESISCIDARDRSMTFSYSALESVSEMTARQLERFDLIRHGQTGRQNGINSW